MLARASRAFLLSQREMTRRDKPRSDLEDTLSVGVALPSAHLGHLVDPVVMDEFHQNLDGVPAGRLRGISRSQRSQSLNPLARACLRVLTGWSEPKGCARLKGGGNKRTWHGSTKGQARGTSSVPSMSAGRVSAMISIFLRLSITTVGEGTRCLKAGAGRPKNPGPPLAVPLISGEGRRGDQWECSKDESS